MKEGLQTKSYLFNGCLQYLFNLYLFDLKFGMAFANYSQQTGTKTVKAGNQKRKLWDNIHGFIYFDNIIWNFIDTCMFQRLRNIKQLGCLEYVFPGATHTRFQHCIGTAHLAQKYVRHLIDSHPEEYPNKQIQNEALLTCTLAGLIHDLGHGPYSHTFDGQIVTQINRNGKNQKWSHEIASVELFRHMNNLQHLKGKLLPDQIQRIITLIEGKVPVNAQRQWQYQLISNSINGIDVDKLDYFRRDAFYLGAKNIYIDHQLLMNEARIIKHSFIEKNQMVTRKVIAYPTKYVETVYNIFHSRYKLYKIYYFNIKSTGIEQMISDVLKLVRDRFKIQRSCESIFNDPSQYLALNDSILEKVFYEYERILQKKQDETYIRAMQALNEFRLKQNSKEKDPVLQQTLKILEEFYNRSQLQYQKQFKEASQLLVRIKNRDIYKFVKELTYQVRQNDIVHADSVFKKEFKKEKIIEKICELGNIDPELICVTIHYVSYGMKDANPLRKVSFFKKEEEDAYGRTIVSQEEAETLSLLFTNAFIESSIKVYIKKDDPNLFLQVDEAFDKFRVFFQTNLKLSKGMGGRTPITTKEEQKSTQTAATEDFVIHKPK